MSVRNILDGTIKVGGGGSIGPNSDVECKTLTAYNQVACLSLNTSALVGDDAQLSTLTVKDEFTATKGIDTALIKCDNYISVPKVITENILTNQITLNNKAILKVQELNTRVTFKGVGLDGTSAKTYTQDVRRFLYDITPSLHVLVINTKLADAIPFKQMIIPLDLETGSGTAAFDTTVIKTSSGYINAIVEINESDGKLQAKFTFDEGTEYTSMQIKVNMIFF